MLCLSCGVVVSVHIVGVIVVCVPLSQWWLWSEKLHILPIYASIPLVYAYEMLGQCGVYFLNGSNFSKFLYVALLSIWLSLEPSCLAQLCTYTWATHREEIVCLSIIFLKLQFFLKKFTFYTFWLIWQTCQRYKVYKCHTTHTEIQIRTDTCTQRHRYRYHFYIFAHHRYTHAQIHRHMYTHRHTHVQTLTHRYT